MNRTFSDGEGGVVRAGRAAYHGLLPPRYRHDQWDVRFRTELARAVEPNQRILDIGSGAQPTLAAEDRPAGVEYVALDPSRSELEKAPEGSYDELIVAPAEQSFPAHEGRFDLALSFMAMEHIKPLDVALRNIRAYIRPGGKLIAQLSGGRSPFALVNRVIPGPVTRWVLARVQERPPETVFPAHYHLCTYSGLSGMLEGEWSEWEVVPLQNGYGYVEFSPVLRALYIGYEEWASRRDFRNIASSYLILATA